MLRHAKSDHSNRDDVSRPLSSEGVTQSQLLPPLFADVAIDAILSSPLRRAMQTLEPLALERNLPIQAIDDLREREAGQWIEEFLGFIRDQWAERSLSLPGGESFDQAQSRLMAAFNSVLLAHHGKTVVIGTHGGALSLILNHYIPSYGFEQFSRIALRMPLIVRLTISGSSLTGATLFPSGEPV